MTALTPKNHIISPKSKGGIKALSSFAILNVRDRAAHKDRTAEHFYKLARKLSFWRCNDPSKEMKTLVEQTSLCSSISVDSLELPAKPSLKEQVQSRIKETQSTDSKVPFSFVQNRMSTYKCNEGPQI